MFTVKLKWVIGKRDVAAVKSLVSRRRNDPFVRLRRQRNLGRPRPKISRSTAWQVLVGCLLTTQQRSGPGTYVTRFLGLSPSPLRYNICHRRKDLEKYAFQTLSKFGGIRRSRSIAAELAANFQCLEGGEWKILLDYARRAEAANDYRVEREAARYIAATLRGFGPKQSRNLLQGLGVSRYEIPIDSRITKWLNRELLTIRLNATMLSDPVYYEMVSDGIIELCKKAGVLPCIFDAAVFSSFDKTGWDKVNLASEELRGA